MTTSTSTGRVNQSCPESSAKRQTPSTKHRHPSPQDVPRSAQNANSPPFTSLPIHNSTKPPQVDPSPASCLRFYHPLPHTRERRCCLDPLFQRGE
ncbi:hypothetical protein DACRYDRAFT_21383 [Dacryopinax primogenitus]|uniref:Uncharacterized protein n=1 Tax=Dacryopinax primogenitus (strain DJM 731) TaxID=1858805 RepID=M5G483_DACPD|nr:uncharacterized protein DACRYDRAFT_21383 [Dacryopinax primogenitus]EJU03030.1 hypothetical protein DACRYDRAFT_21383 [Dacryopinax primogenitus]